jgi:hypothetical protein
MEGAAMLVLKRNNQGTCRTGRSNGDEEIGKILSEIPTEVHQP